MSLATFRALFEGISATRAAALHPYFLTALLDGRIDTCARVAAFVAQVGHAKVSEERARIGALR